MNSTNSFFGLIIAAIIIAVIFAVFVVILKSPKIRGKRGEAYVSFLLGKTKRGKRYVINNLLFKNLKGNSCQIDHVCINKYGIWVIETKNYSGRIYGNDGQDQWTQVLAYGRKKNKLYNPVKQNAAHINHLAGILKRKDIFHNVVVFISKANLSHVNSSNVIKTSALKRTLKRSTGILLSNEEMEEYYSVLMNLKNENTVTEKEHVAKIKENKRKINLGICPNCGGELIVRKGQYGKFYGCSNFPKCTFKKNIR